MKPKTLEPIEADCPEGGQHDPEIESDDVPELLNGHLGSTIVTMCFCKKCGERLELPERGDEID